MIEKKSNIGVLDLWQITFFILKISGVIDWKWGLVFLPYIILLSGLLIVSIIDNISDKPKNKNYKLKRGE